MLAKAYEKVFKELSCSDRYLTYNVAEFYVDKKQVSSEDKVNVIVRVDVDNAFHKSVELAQALNEYGINHSQYFLTHPERFYNLWDSNIPRKVSDLGAEVGVHSYHKFICELAQVDPQETLLNDIQRLTTCIGHKVRGVIAHGDIEYSADQSVQIYSDHKPNALGLDYHEGQGAGYKEWSGGNGKPICDINISDFMGIRQTRGWNILPEYPLKKLRSAKPGDVVHIAFHTANVFEDLYDTWTSKYGEKCPERITLTQWWRKKMCIYVIHYVKPIPVFFIKKAGLYNFLTNLMNR